MFQSGLNGQRQLVSSLVLGSHRRWPIRHEERLHALGTFSQRIPKPCRKWASGDEVRGERPQMLFVTYR